MSGHDDKVSSERGTSFCTVDTMDEKRVGLAWELEKVMRYLVNCCSQGCQSTRIPQDSLTAAS